MIKILIMGLPGTGKTTLAQELRKQLIIALKSVVWYNADIVRELNNDWDFSEEGRLRQAKRMRDLADYHKDVDFVICDFVAPTQEIRNIFDADFIIWMNTEKNSNYQDTDKIFENPEKVDYTITAKDAKILTPYVVKAIIK